ncbi:ribosome maturation factor RimP [Streptomyces sp. 2224.1]|uniref:ribosome maturation factor RimP n=1 Tax=unclassified Streptomyces TaxID=2593676 RepID=UPI00088501EC|nr:MULTISPECIES: ribosome maturation factor RimP [unclassified Streptomyces]PBC85381.1 ribosome maturation factor RimP [Streptomyces sp. 2321.6]SDR16345.1 ribosome maturation factor RimP [Streptomyces sp. KS_16]SEB48925.1 ribosome maturation factor RimP [Streptomyces sp. 2224.1]SED66094.1 ribosome maturation factor RimP [Streptomyces sp. 2133.1]SEE17021.1 ribosome maturation factor RimP [Streptomyces sp. 2112.3]
MSTTQSERLRGLLEPLVAARDLDLEEIEVTPAGKRRVLRIVVDSDEGVQLDECAELSREASQVLDDSDVMGGAPYTLEVTSPGADRPLTELRHYRRAVGRLIKAQLHEGGELVARITAVDDAGLDLEVPGVKGRKPTTRRVSFDEIAKARVELEFSRKPDRTDKRDAQHDEKIDENKEEA